MWWSHADPSTCRGFVCLWRVKTCWTLWGIYLNKVQPLIRYSYTNIPLTLFQNLRSLPRCDRFWLLAAVGTHLHGCIAYLFIFFKSGEQTRNHDSATWIDFYSDDETEIFLFRILTPDYDLAKLDIPTWVSLFFKSVRCAKCPHWGLNIKEPPGNV